MTDLILLEQASSEARQPIYGLAEYQHPSGSVKHRPAERMIEQALATGEIRPGHMIVEATAGNTGIALAEICAENDLGLTIFCYDSVSEHKVEMMRARGARVYRVADKCHSAREYVRLNPGSLYVDQYNNPANPESHHATAQEIFEQQPDIGGIAVGVGTGGTLLGIQQWCQLNRPDTELAYLHAQPGSRAEGIGTGTPSSFRPQLKAQHEFTIPDQIALRWMKTYSIGPSAAINVQGAILLARRIKRPVATVLCDGQDRYQL